MEVVSAFGIRSDAKKVEKATAGVRTPGRHCAEVTGSGSHLA
jgi:hypothetical protein